MFLRMDCRNGCPLGFLTLFIIFWINSSYGIPHHRNSMDKDHHTNEPVYNLQLSSAIPAPTTVVSSFHNDNNKEAKAKLPITFPMRHKRDTSPKTIPLPYMQYFLPPNAATEVQKYFLFLNSKPKPVWADDYDEDYDPPAIELVHGKKPGSIKSSVGDSSDGSATVWASEEPISINRHRVGKRSHSTPELFLREAAASSRTQPDPLFVRKLLARISNSRKIPQAKSDVDANSNYRPFSVGQLFEHSSKVDDDDGPVIHRLVL
ncbi:unnamed protein product [Orchesella dallaii]|uniref:Uncharacterized protein n=1 Tax=Orchesella dallaii TaxID=48710 RepID=A0ABP1QM91_9HEXA